MGCCCAKIQFKKIKFLESVQDGNLTSTKTIYHNYGRNNGELLEFRDLHGRAALHIAAYNGHTRLLRYLLEEMKKHNIVAADLLGPNRDNAISFACMRGYKEEPTEEKYKRRRIVGFLVDAGVDVNAVNKLTKMTPLHWACYYDDAATIDVLLRNRADESKLNKEKLFAIDIAGQMALAEQRQVGGDRKASLALRTLLRDYLTHHENDLPDADIIIDKRIHPVVRRKAGTRRSSFSRNMRTIPLLKKNKSIAQKIASCLLFWGAMDNNTEIVKLLIQKGISPFQLQYKELNSMMIATQQGALEAFRAILDFHYFRKGKFYTIIGMNQTDRDGNNVLHHACLMNNMEAYELITSYKYVNKNVRNAYGFFPYELTTSEPPDEGQSTKTFEYCFTVDAGEEDDFVKTFYDQFNMIGFTPIKILQAKPQSSWLPWRTTKALSNIIFEVPEDLYLDTAEKLKIKMPIKKGKLLLPFKAARADEFLPFMPRHRHSMIDFLLTKEIPDLNRYKKVGIVKDHFPLHDLGSYTREREPAYREHMVSLLQDKQFSLMWGWIFGQTIRSLEPLHHIANYHGEKIAWYVAWMTFYTSWLLIPIIPGIIVGLYQMAVQDVDSLLVPFYCVFMFLWFTIFTQIWKRRQRELATYWNCSSFRRKDAERAEYAGELTINKVTMQKWRKAYTHSFLRNVFFSFPTLTTFLATIIVAFIAFRTWSAVDTTFEHTILVGIVNAISITALNYVYKYLSVVLVNWENHRYEEQWDNSYTVKNFALQFVNTYISLFAIAFYDKNMEKVAINLAAILIVKQFAMNILEILVPLFKYKYQIWSFTKNYWEMNTKNAESFLGLEIIKNQIMGKTGRLALQYSEMAIQLGFITLFAPAFPPAAIFAFINNILEIRGELNDLSFVKKRTVAEGGAGIGAWIPIIDFMSYITVVVNCAVIFWTCESWEGFLEDSFDLNDPMHQLYVVIIAEHIAIIIKMLIGQIISEASIQLLEEQNFAKKSQKLLSGALMEEEKATTTGTGTGIGIGTAIGLGIKNEENMFLSAKIHANERRRQDTSDDCIVYDDSPEHSKILPQSTLQRKTLPPLKGATIPQRKSLPIN